MRRTHVHPERVVWIIGVGAGLAVASCGEAAPGPAATQPPEGNPSLVDGDRGVTTCSDRNDCACEPGTVRRCFDGDAKVAGVGACVWGTQLCEAAAGGGELASGRWGACVGAGHPSVESCNLQDDDCDGRVDDGAACTRDVLFATNTPPDAVLRALAAGGITSDTGPATDETIDRYKVVVVTGAGLAVSEAKLVAWVGAGGGLMSLTVGAGLSGECEGLGNLQAAFGFGYDCAAVYPWGPVTAVGPHRIAQGLVPQNFPFVNGTRVSERAAGSTHVVAVAGEAVVGRAAEIGRGRVFVYGDEHPFYPEYVPASIPFWIQSIHWLRGP